MNDFIAKYQDQLSGTLLGFDRLVFRGTLWKNQLTGMSGYLWAHGLGAKDFGSHAEDISKRLKEASLAPVLAAGRPVRYLNSGKLDKQKIAAQIAAAASDPTVRGIALEIDSFGGEVAGEDPGKGKARPRIVTRTTQADAHPAASHVSLER